MHLQNIKGKELEKQPEKRKKKKKRQEEMYVTRPLSMYLRDPSGLSIPTPEGPNSGVLVIQDEEATSTFCFGLFKSDRVTWGLPFPQNKNLMVRYVQQAGEHQHVHRNRVLFIPVLNQPLSSNQYYVIKRKGKHKGEAYISSKEEDMKTRCFCRCISDLKPQRLDPGNIDQQFEIRHRSCSSFVAKSVDSDGFPPKFLRRKGWRVCTSTPKEFQLDEARGLNAALRARLPDFNFPLSEKYSTPVVVGKWYCPFMFIIEGEVKDQMKNSTYYEMTLEQQWEQIFSREKGYKKDNAITVDVEVECEVAAVAGTKAVHDLKNVVDGVKWFKGFSKVSGEISVGLRLEIVEKMKQEQERAGWVGRSENQVRVKRIEEFDDKGAKWGKFGCYVLVERFVLKRMDGSLVLTYDFRHTHQIRSKWE